MTTTSNDPIDALRAERPESPASSELALRVLHDALASSTPAAVPTTSSMARTPRRTSRRVLRPAFALAAVAIAAGIAITANLVDGPALTGIEAARAEAIHTLRASEPRRFELRITTYAGTGRQPVNRSTLTAWDDDVHYVLGPTRTGASAGSVEAGWESIEVDGRSYERTMDDDRDVVATEWTHDPATVVDSADRGTFVLQGDALADLLVRLGGTTRSVPGGGIEITVSGTAHELAPAEAPDGASDNGRLGLFGMFDPIGDLASEVDSVAPSARILGVVRFDAQHRVVQVDASRVNTTRTDDVTRRVVDVSYDVDDVRAPDPGDVTVAHRPVWIDGDAPPLDVYGRLSALDAADLERIVARIQRMDQTVLDAVDRPTSAAGAPTIDSPYREIDAAWQQATLAELAADVRCEAIDPTTGRPTRDEPDDLAAVTWRCSDRGVRYTREPGVGSDAVLPGGSMHVPAG